MTVSLFKTDSIRLITQTQQGSSVCLTVNQVSIPANLLQGDGVPFRIAMKSFEFDRQTNLTALYFDPEKEIPVNQVLQPPVNEGLSAGSEQQIGKEKISNGLSNEY
jgi:hypothetical protein